MHYDRETFNVLYLLEMFDFDLLFRNRILWQTSIAGGKDKKKQVSRSWPFLIQFFMKTSDGRLFWDLLIWLSLSPQTPFRDSFCAQAGSLELQPSAEGMNRMKQKRKNWSVKNHRVIPCPAASCALAGRWQSLRGVERTLLCCHSSGLMGLGHSDSPACAGTAHCQGWLIKTMLGGGKTPWVALTLLLAQPQQQTQPCVWQDRCSHSNW